MDLSIGRAIGASARGQRKIPAGWPPASMPRKKYSLKYNRVAAAACAVHGRQPRRATVNEMVRTSRLAEGAQAGVV
jgi:hypothetical protein